MADIYSISLQGMQNAQLRIERAAQNIANGHSPAPASGPAVSADSVQLSAHQADPVDYAREAVTIIEAKIATEADLKVMAAQKEVDRSTLDLIA